SVRRVEIRLRRAGSLLGTAPQIRRSADTELGSRRMALDRDPLAAPSTTGRAIGAETSESPGVAGLFIGFYATVRPVVHSEAGGLTPPSGSSSTMTRLSSVSPTPLARTGRPSQRVMLRPISSQWSLFDG